jgi:hypothetical protein
MVTQFTEAVEAISIVHANQPGENSQRKICFAQVSYI